MPSISAHIGCALKVMEKLNITDDRFIFGVLLPDITVIDKMQSHYKVQGTFFMVPDLELYKSKFDLSDPLYFGYYFHLYLDYYYLEDYLENNQKGIDVFAGPTLYHDYDILNKDLVEHYNMDVDKIEKILRENANEEVSKKKLYLNINCLHLNQSGELTYLEKDKFISFLDKEIDNFINEMK